MRRGLCTLYDQSPSALCLGNPVARDLHVVIGREHWQGRRALSNHVCAHSVISMWHVVCLQHLARACSEQSRSTTVLPINHVIQMPQCLSGFVNHDYLHILSFTLCCVKALVRFYPCSSGSSTGLWIIFIIFIYLHRGLNHFSDGF